LEFFKVGELLLVTETKELIQKAAEGLRLTDIFLLGSLFERPFTPDEDEFEFVQQFKRAVEFAVMEPLEIGRAKELQVKVEFGTRFIYLEAGSTPEDLTQDSKNLAVIEATFVVEYEILGEIDENALKAFSEINAVHNAWPFWRQHVFDVKQRARLPTSVEVPLLSLANMLRY
jgi:hypothetical protein